MKKNNHFIKNDSIITKLFLIVWIFLFYSSPITPMLPIKTIIVSKYTETNCIDFQLKPITNIVRNFGRKKNNLIDHVLEGINSYRF